MTLQEAKQRVLAMPFAYPSAATMIEREVAAAMLADHCFVQLRREANPVSSCKNQKDRTEILEWMRGRGDTMSQDLHTELGISRDKASGILSDLFTRGAIDRVTQARAQRAIYRLD